ncbi:response regulator [Phormidium sp. LEGE 05292]|uniref:response regulator n=1 Tax=[Phormidium] sp. LEGE 05292 TaxID=767427 RepID=UPI00187EEC67|nr:response regulator [Phormidium sp. LEGE 05292]MBE9227970.1 response regulator [Phormidium sp. LEGE 05292]
MCNSALLRKGLRVLIVDNDLDSRELLAIIFKEYGVETIAATCVSESLEIMQQTQPDLVIGELALPKEDGYDLIRKLKAFETRYHVRIPAIALTTLDGKYHRIRALAAGFCKHLCKPFELEELIATVACVTEQVQEMTAVVCN